MYKKSSKISSIINFVKMMPKYIFTWKMKMLESIASLYRNVREK